MNSTLLYLVSIAGTLLITPMLFSRLYKARYFPDSHLFGTSKGHNPSFIWQGIKTTLENLRNGYKWVVGDGKDIYATKDQRLRDKENFSVEDSHVYAGRSDKVASYFETDSRMWNVQMVTENFLPNDAKSILSIPIPQHEVKDRLVWAASSSGIYTAKEGYWFWQNHSINMPQVIQSQGWQRI